jgi:hypothetical protein
MRAALNSIMAVVIVAALFWGNCYSCPQMLLAQQRHGCCPHGKTTRSECQTQVLKTFVKAEKGSEAGPAVVVPVASAPVAKWAPVTVAAFSLIEYTPPLQISLRI